MTGHDVDDSRVIDTVHSNVWQLLHVSSAWGYNPFVLRRTVQFMALTQGQNPDTADYSMPISQYSPLFKLLRCRYVLREQAGTLLLGELPKALPHLALMGQYKVGCEP